MRFVPPAGTPIGIADFVRWFSTALSGSTVLKKFADAVQQKFGIRHCFFLSSGRAALALIAKVLYELRDEPDRNEIVVPAYTCYSVPASVIKAGLKVRLCDVDPNTLGLDLDKLRSIDYRKVLAIVSGNLYGIPNQLAEIEKIAKEKGVYFIDDAAQSLGAKWNGQAAGTFGDVGLYSLDKGKNITSLQGGLIVTNDDAIAHALQKTIAQLPPTPTITVVIYLIKTLIYSLLLRPGLYWIPRSIPFLGLGQTAYETDYPVTQFSPTLAALGFTLFNKLDAINGTRTHNGNAIRKRIQSAKTVRTIALPAEATPVYLRFPILVQDAVKRSKLIEALEQAGIGATISYPQCLKNLPDIQFELVNAAEPMPGGREVAACIVTLPTHAYVLQKDIAKMAQVIG